jgi:hypothetical protein
VVSPELLAGRPGRTSLARIDAIVSAKLGLTRVRGNAQPAVGNRQVAMYLAKYVGGWSTTAIGRFYNGRDHSTVCYSIKRVETKRERSPEFAQLIEELAAAIRLQTIGPSQQPSKSPKVDSTEPPQTAGFDKKILNALAEQITDHVVHRIVEQLRILLAAKDGRSPAIVLCQCASATDCPCDHWPEWKWPPATHR